jgi:hypothetical protein
MVKGLNNRFIIGGTLPMALARMRTIHEAIKYIKEKDPGSAITEWWLRNAIKTGKIPHVEAGCRFLVNLDMLESLMPGREQPSDIDIDEQTLKILEKKLKRREPTNKTILEYDVGEGIDRLIYSLISSCEIDPDASSVFLRMPKQMVENACKALSDAMNNRKVKPGNLADHE